VPKPNIVWAKFQIIRMLIYI